MSCRNCFDNCDKPTSDKCVKYTGPEIEWLGICTGDQLSVVEAALIEKLSSALDGSGITFEDLTTCDAIDDALGDEDPTLANLVQALLTVVCAIKEEVDDIQDDSNPPSSFVTDCLTLPSNPTKDNILQAVTIKLCSVSDVVDTISEDYVKASELCTLVAECLADTSEVIVQEYSKMPKYVALPYHGSLSVFDANGKGLLAAGYDKIYMCVGQTVNGFNLPDYRGRTPIGANIGMPGAAMDANVDPSVLANAGYNISQNVKRGNFTHTLTISQLPSHSHPVTDPGHDHDLEDYVTDASGGLSYVSLKGDVSDNGPNPISTTTEVTGITIGNAGSSQPHNNTQPSMGTVFIMYVPS